MEESASGGKGQILIHIYVVTMRINCARNTINVFSLRKSLVAKTLRPLCNVLYVILLLSTATAVRLHRAVRRSAVGLSSPLSQSVSDIQNRKNRYVSMSRGAGSQC